MKTILIIITIATVAMGQSDSLKLQASNVGKLAITTTIAATVTAVEAGKTAIVASKEIYNSKTCQQGIKTSKVLISKGWKFIVKQVDSLGN